MKINLKIINRKVIYYLISTISIILIFSLIYWSIGDDNNFRIVSNEKQLTFLDAVYFSAESHATIGYGDITPKSVLAKTLNILHITIMILLLAIFFITV